ncbi:nucleotide triphosphate diphosphatase NUDT15 [Aspergillus ibericus CBS 121593]|uniref:Nudix hydrolase domain-containing protein n=1 Tax=Aspergillus ibericus CBS 121593 TaxID=1448316 RepID=A0A395GSK6_9EURO|nr:hypothetical protein BO80DRAFT_482811 [Aspergillus ibericus CBS 121593]RAK97063.1 hypothetical protein BO80DRAFT_482811 [Aspergillus ibericus CBS 121593]
MTTTTTDPRIRVGIAAFIFNPSGQILLGQRKGSHGTWALPGGHLEAHESWEACAAREVQEETGLSVQEFRHLTTTNDVIVMDDGNETKYYTTVFLGCVLCDGDAVPKVMEPDQCGGWEWATWDEVRSYYEVQRAAEEGGSVEGVQRRLFTPMLNLFRQREGFDPLVGYGCEWGWGLWTVVMFLFDVGKSNSKKRKQEEEGDESKE